MDRIAIISDIHGNLEALKTVLQDIKLRGIEKIYCLGDIVAKGCNSEECVNLIKENCEIVLRKKLKKPHFIDVFSAHEPSNDIVRVSCLLWTGRGCRKWKWN